MGRRPGLTEKGSFLLFFERLSGIVSQGKIIYSEKTVQPRLDYLSIDQPRLEWTPALHGPEPMNQ